MARTDNLKSLADRSPEERRKIAAAGGKASGESRRRSKEMRERIASIVYLNAEHIHEERENLLANAFMNEPDTIVTDIYQIPSDYEPKQVIDLICKAIVERAIEGDAKAISMVLSSLGDAE